ncbi:hypothetical protein [Paenibacillus ferrarius]|uniref:hypothetical protein n=1 Tax=Paenibacillus ferrarius TaxID=1469647 RepID=UPI001ABF5D2E|nr:hypothetical protein [Paenibacillus ferrarius]
MELTFRFKMVYFQYIVKENRPVCLELYLQILERNFKIVADFEWYLLQHKPEPEKQRVQLLWVFDHRKRMGEVEIQWMKEEIEKVRTDEV